MITKTLDSGNAPLPREGDLYKTVTVAGKTFELYYGYYEEFEREYNDPMPLYPDLVQKPEYTCEGHPIVTGMQDICTHYCGSDSGDSCSSCLHFQNCEELFGICTCLKRRKEEQSDGT